MKAWIDLCVFIELLKKKQDNVAANDKEYDHGKETHIH